MRTIHSTKQFDRAVEYDNKSHKSSEALYTGTVILWDYESTASDQLFNNLPISQVWALAKKSGEIYSAVVYADWFRHSLQASDYFKQAGFCLYPVGPGKSTRQYLVDAIQMNLSLDLGVFAILGTTELLPLLRQLQGVHCRKVWVSQQPTGEMVVKLSSQSLLSIQNNVSGGNQIYEAV
ncbi:MAG: hypothetical protein ACFFBD_07300 [Candidatus Hodarchaeota archaeon]